MTRPRHLPALLALAALLAFGCQKPGAAPAATADAASTPADPVPRHDSLMLESKAVSETRRINVHTPEGYAGSSTRFPVLYMPDGGVAEDFPHVVNTLDSLVELGEARPFIVVGIENTERRRDMTGPTTVGTDSAIAPRVGGSAAFRRFIREELMPEIEAKYRTTGETGIIGESLVGLFIMETLLAEPKLFDRYIAFSPSIWWNRDELVRTAPERVKALEGLDRTLYLTAASDDVTPRTDTLASVIHGARLTGFTFYYEPMPQEKHATIYRAAGPVAMKAALGAKGPHGS
jgi:predicted alpha/beta superfamily hydrolase